MSPEDRLEHLISRELDGEITPEERAALAQWFQREPATRATYESYRDLDRELGAALRGAMRAHQPAIFSLRRRSRFGHDYWSRAALVAVAAAIAAFAWLTPNRANHGGKLHPNPNMQTARLLPTAQVVDQVMPVTPEYERPELRVRGTQRDYILIPGREPGTVIILEVDRVRTRAIGMQKDF